MRQRMARLPARRHPARPGRSGDCTCGPTSFVETVSQALVQSGYPPQRIKTERFGATGGT